MSIKRVGILAGLLVAALLVVGGTAAATTPFVGPFHTVSTLASTVPANGDVNPYGVAVVPRTTGALRRGDVLVSNFNDGGNLQGTGTTIVQVAPNGTVSTFASVDAAHLPGACPGGVGLTTALVALRSGWVIVGSLPTTDGTAATAQAGCLLVLDATGRVRETFSGHGINGPWDMTALDRGSSALTASPNRAPAPAGSPELRSSVETRRWVGQDVLPNPPAAGKGLLLPAHGQPASR